MRLLRPAKIDATSLVSSNVPEPEVLWNVGATYADGDRVYKLVLGIHQSWESQVNSNVGQDPELDDDESHWLALGPTNRFAMLDQTIQSQTSNPNSIAVGVQLPPDDVADTVYVANIDAQTLTVVVTDPLDGEVRSVTVDLLSDVGIIDWYEFYFEPPRRLREKVVDNLGLYAGATIEVTLEAYGETVRCGALVAGFSRTLGGTRWNPSLGIRDYSLKGENSFGDFVVVPKNYRKRASFGVVVETVNLDAVVETLTDYRATPLLFIGSAQYASMTVYGFFKDFNVEVAGKRISYLSLDLEGLT